MKASTICSVLLVLVGLIATGASDASPQNKTVVLVVGHGYDHPGVVAMLKALDAEDLILVVSRENVISKVPFEPLTLRDMELVESYALYRRSPENDSYLTRSKRWLKWNNLQANAFHTATIDLTSRCNC